MSRCQMVSWIRKLFRLFYPGGIGKFSKNIIVLKCIRFTVKYIRGVVTKRTLVKQRATKYGGKPEIFRFVSGKFY